MPFSRISSWLLYQTLAIRCVDLTCVFMFLILASCPSLCAVKNYQALIYHASFTVQQYVLLKCKCLLIQRKTVYSGFNSIIHTINHGLSNFLQPGTPLKSLWPIIPIYFISTSIYSNIQTSNYSNIRHIYLIVQNNIIAIYWSRSTLYNKWKKMLNTVKCI